LQEKCKQLHVFNRLQIIYNDNKLNWSIILFDD